MAMGKDDRKIEFQPFFYIAHCVPSHSGSFLLSRHFPLFQNALNPTVYAAEVNIYGPSAR